MVEVNYTRKLQVWCLHFKHATASSAPVALHFNLLYIFYFEENCSQVCDQIDGARKLVTWSCLFVSSLGSKTLLFLTCNPRLWISGLRWGVWSWQIGFCYAASDLSHMQLQATFPYARKKVWSQKLKWIAWKNIIFDLFSWGFFAETSEVQEDRSHLLKKDQFGQLVSSFFV